MENNYNAENQPVETPPAAGVKKRRSPFPSWYDYLVLALLFVISQLVLGFVAMKCGYTPDLGSETPAPAVDVHDFHDTAMNAVARSTALGYIAGMVSMIVMTLIYRRLRGGHGRVARFSPQGFDPSLLLEGFIVLLAANIVVEPLVQLLPGVPDYENVLGRGGWALLSTVICAPIFEEFIFRGIILESTRHRFGVIAAWLISSLCFGLAHGLPAQMTAAGVIGLVLGYVYIRSGSLFSGIVLHALNNALAMLLLILGLGDKVLSELVGSKTYMAIYAVSAVILLWWVVGACRTLRRIRRTERDASY